MKLIDLLYIKIITEQSFKNDKMKCYVFSQNIKNENTWFKKWEDKFDNKELSEQEFLKIIDSIFKRKSISFFFCILKPNQLLLVDAKKIIANNFQHN